jgi:hypothetical protein
MSGVNRFFVIVANKNMKNKGWVSIYRQIWDNPISKKPNYLSVWLFLLCNVNHKDGYFIFNNKKEVCKRGQIYTGRSAISRETGVSESSVENILTYFEKDGQIEQQKYNKFRLITVTNYNTYQEVEQQKDNKKTTKRQQKDTNNNNNNNNNENKQSLEIKISDAGLQNDEAKTPSSIKGKEGGKSREISDASGEETSQIVKIIEAFKRDINPLLDYGSVPERRACLRLIRGVGIDEVRRAYKYYLTIKDDRYAKTITTPREFEKNFAWIGQYSLKINNQ